MKTKSPVREKRRPATPDGRAHFPSGLSESGAGFTRKVKDAIRSVPKGRVATYGQIAALAGNERAARQVAWILHSSSPKDRLPWHRVINARGGISLKRGAGFEEQMRRLKAESVGLSRNGYVNLARHVWQPSIVRSRALRNYEKFLESLEKGSPPR